MKKIISLLAVLLSVAVIVILLVVRTITNTKEKESSSEEITSENNCIVYNESDKRIKDMTDEEAYELMLELGLVFPDAYSDSKEETKINAVTMHIDRILETGDPTNVSFSPSVELGLRIRTIVIEYEGLEDKWDEEIYKVLEENYDFRRPYT